MKKHLEYSDDKSNKFWEIEVSGKSHTVTYGKIGSSGTSKTKEFDTEEKAVKDAEKLIKAKTKKGYIEVAMTQQTNEAPIDVQSDLFWKKFEQEFYENAKLAVQQIVEQGIKQDSLKFWVHVVYEPFFIYDDNAAELAEFDVPILWKLYEAFDSGEQEMPIEYSELERLLYKHGGAMLKKMAKNNCFNKVSNNHLSILFETVDSSAELICSVGDLKKVKNIFEEKPLNFDLSMLGKGKAKEKWWFAKCAFVDDEVECKCVDGLIGEFPTTWLGHSIKESGKLKFEASVLKTKKINDWMSSDSHEIFSYKLKALWEALGIQNVEYFPIHIEHKGLQQKSATFYHFANIVGYNNMVLMLDKKDDEIQAYKSISFRKNRIRGRKKALDKTELKMFRIQSKKNFGFVIDNEVKLAMETNKISGVEYTEIPFWEIDELATIEKQIKEGEEDALCRKGMLYLEGFVVEQDINKAIDIFEEVLRSDKHEPIEHFLLNDDKWKYTSLNAYNYLKLINYAKIYSLSSMYDYYAKNEYETLQNRADKLVIETFKKFNPNINQNAIEAYKQRKKNRKEKNKLENRYLDEANEEKHLDKFQKAIEDGNNLDRVYNDLGVFYNYTLKDTKKAKEAYEKALEINPEYDYAYSNLADLVALKGDTVGAITHYQKAVDLGTLWKTAYFELTELYITNQQYEKASAVLNSFKTIDLLAICNTSDFVIWHFLEFILKTAQGEDASETYKLFKKVRTRMSKYSRINWNTSAISNWLKTTDLSDEQIASIKDICSKFDKPQLFKKQK